MVVSSWGCTAHKPSIIHPHFFLFMKLATWNINSLNVRLPHVLNWLADNPMDALCLQELKQTDDRFPIDAFREAGYEAHWAGQKTYNGVAIITPVAGQDEQRNIPGFDDPQQRVIAVTLPSPVGEIRVICVYCPNGQSIDSDKYLYKLNWYKALHGWLEKELKRYPLLAVLGDYNVAPRDEDVHDPELWKGQVLVSDPERAAFQGLLDLGLVDSFLQFEHDEKPFTWWDYRRMAFRRNAGLRIDHILLSRELMKWCTACVIDREPRGQTQPSDHTPVIATLDFSVTTP